jgi:palmitoyltransferase
MPRPVHLRSRDTRWVVRIIPFFIAAAFGFATYVVTARLCVDYLLREKGENGRAAALLALYFLSLILTLVTYVRIFTTVQFDPAIVPLPPGREEPKEQTDRPRANGRYPEPEPNPWTPPDEDPDSPGLEAFYSKDVFVCEADGRPKWCSECKSWKPDRSHHSSELGRCVRKLDHVCPWVGGMVSETSFNFFLQFTFYTTFLCAVTLGTGGVCLRQQQRDGRSLDGFVVAAIVLSGFFGFFTFAMTVTSGRFLFTNTTNIDLLRKAQVYQLAIRVPSGYSTSSSQLITYPLPSRTNYGTQLNGNASDRDQRATRTFAIVRTEAGENPWHLGYWRNFKSVMGSNPLEWFLPIRHSPCCYHDSMVSDYELGPLVEELKKRFGLPEESGGSNGVEMRERKQNGRSTLV